MGEPAALFRIELGTCGIRLSKGIPTNSLSYEEHALLRLFSTATTTEIDLDDSLSSVVLDNFIEALMETELFLASIFVLSKIRFS